VWEFFTEGNEKNGGLEMSSKQAKRSKMSDINSGRVDVQIRSVMHTDIQRNFLKNALLFHVGRKLYALHNDPESKGQRPNQMPNNFKYSWLLRDDESWSLSVEAVWLINKPKPQRPKKSIEHLGYKISGVTYTRDSIAGLSIFSHKEKIRQLKAEADRLKKQLLQYEKLLPLMPEPIVQKHEKLEREQIYPR
jgi:hypothetical protein